MDKAADIFFQHFGIQPGRSTGHVHRIAEAFGEVPWENLTKFLLKASGTSRPRFAEEVMEGHVHNGTGGTCYSLADTLVRIISACGLSARPLTGHMKHGRNIHCAILVQGDSGRFILDPGYVVPGAVELSSGGSGIIQTPGRKMLWKPVPEGWELHTVENGESRYRYTLESRVITRREFLEYWKASFASKGLDSLPDELGIFWCSPWFGRRIALPKSRKIECQYSILCFQCRDEGHHACSLSPPAVQENNRVTRALVNIYQPDTLNDHGRHGGNQGFFEPDFPWEPSLRRSDTS